MALFHVDTSGNLWLGDTSNTFTTSAPFYVTSSGAVKAASIDLTIQEEDDADGTGGGNKRIDLGSSGSKIYDFGGDIFINANDDVIVKDVLRLAETSGSVSEPSLLFGSSSASSGSSINPVAGLTSRLVSADTHGGSSSNLARQLEVANGSTYVMRFNSENDEVEIPGDIKLSSTSDIYIGTDPGGNGDFLKKSGGNLVWGTASSVSVQGSGDISVSESNNVYTVSHDDSDHSFASTSSVTANTNSILSVSGSLSTHENDSTAHGSFDNYGSWTLRGNPSGNLQTSTIGSGGSASIYAGSNMTSSMSGSSITLSASGIQSISQSGGDGFVKSVSGSTVNTSSILGNIAIYTGSHYPESSFNNLGASNDRWYRLYAQVTTSVSSDERLKENIVDINQGLDFINDLRPVEFTWRDVTEYACEDYPDDKYNKTRDFCTKCKKENDIAYSNYLLEKEKFDNELIEDEPTEPTFTACTWVETTTDINEGKKSWGMIAQEVETTLGDYDGQVLNHDTVNDVYGLSYSSFVAPIIKAVQELSTQVSDLTARIEALEG